MRCGWDRHEVMAMMAVGGVSRWWSPLVVWTESVGIWDGPAGCKAAYVTSQDPCHTPGRPEWTNEGQSCLYQNEENEKRE